MSLEPPILGDARLAAASILVSDLRRAEDFYVGVLGMNPHAVVYAAGDVPSCAIVCSEHFELTLIRADAPVPSSSLGVYVSDLDAAMATLAARGHPAAYVGSTDVGHRMDYARCALLRDPDGNTVRLMQVQPPWTE